jgi:hypothetical protein
MTIDRKKENLAMRTYLVTDVPTARAVFANGWHDTHCEFGREGVCLSTVPLDARDGFDGDVTLCLDVPEDLFDRFDLTDEVQEASGYRLALVPAVELNKLGKPLVYDHTFAGSSRRELCRSIETWEQSPQSNRHADGMKEAVRFFDEIGWRTPLKLKEAQGTNAD